MKKRHVQKVMATLMAVMLAFGMTACGSEKEPAADTGTETTAATAETTTTSGEKCTVVIIPKLVHEFYNLFLDGANQAVDELSKEGKEVEVIWSAPTTADVVEQTEKLEAAIAMNPDYIVISVIDGESCKPLMEQAQAAGIKVIAADTNFDGSPADAFVGCSTDAQYESGKMAADQLVKMIGKDTGKVAMLIGSPDAENHILFSGGFRDQMKEKYPGYEIVTEQADNDNKEKATELTEAILAQYPDIDGIFGGDGSAGVGAAIALESAVKAGQIKDGQVYISNYCLMADPEAALRSGYLSCIIDYSPYWIGYYATEIAAAEKFDGIPLQDVDMEFAIVTEENLDSYDYGALMEEKNIEYWKQ